MWFGFGGPEAEEESGFGKLEKEFARQGIIFFLSDSSAAVGVANWAVLVPDFDKPSPSALGCRGSAA